MRTAATSNAPPLRSSVLRWARGQNYPEDSAGGKAKLQPAGRALPSAGDVMKLSPHWPDCLKLLAAIGLILTRRATNQLRRYPDTAAAEGFRIGGMSCSLVADADLKPHRSPYWLNSHHPDFEAKARDIGQLYVKAPQFYQQGPGHLL